MKFKNQNHIFIIIVEGCALVPPRQFIRTSGGSWAFPGAVFSGLGRILGGLGGVLGPLEGVLVSWGRLESFVGRLGGVLGAFWWATWFDATIDRNIDGFLVRIS